MQVVYVEQKGHTIDIKNIDKDEHTAQHKPAVIHNQHQQPEQANQSNQSTSFQSRFSKRKLFFVFITINFLCWPTLAGTLVYQSQLEIDKRMITNQNANFTVIDYCTAVEACGQDHNQQCYYPCVISQLDLSNGDVKGCWVTEKDDKTFGQSSAALLEAQNRWPVGSGVTIFYAENGFCSNEYYGLVSQTNSILIAFTVAICVGIILFILGFSARITCLESLF